MESCKSNLQWFIKLSEIDSRVVEEVWRWWNIKKQLSRYEFIQTHHILPLKREVLSIYIWQLLGTNNFLIVWNDKHRNHQKCCVVWKSTWQVINNQNLSSAPSKKKQKSRTETAHEFITHKTTLTLSHLAWLIVIRYFPLFFRLTLCDSLLTQIKR